MSSLVALIVVLVAIALIVVLVFLAARYGLVDKLRRRFCPARPSPPREASELAPPASLGTAIAIALNELRMRASAAADPRTAPWALVIGSGGAELEALLPPQRRAEHRVSWLDKPGKARAGSISFREQGVVIGFERGLVGEPDALAQLVDVLRELEAIRPDRPVDSLVVTVPLSEIMADMRDPAAAERVVARGRDLYELILAAQSRTGWRLPLYILVTGGEKIPGFARLAATTVARNPSPAIGWAATTPIDRAFEPAWVDEAFDSMLSALSVEQLHLLMGIEEGEEAEAALLLPERFAEVRPAMRLLMSNMLHATAYHEAFMLRGVFLTGAVDPAPAAPLPVIAPDEAPPSESGAGPAGDPPSEPVPVAPQPLAARLFLDKVFLERGLAQPAYGEVTRRHRLVHRTQWAIAATALLFMAGLTGLQFEDRTQLPPVRLLLAQVADVKKISRPGGVRVVGRGSDERCVGTDQPPGWDREGERRTAISLLNQMALIDVDQIETVFAPTSFLTNVTAKVKQAMEAGFRNIIFQAVIGQMTTESGIDELLRRGLPAEKSAETNWPLIVTNARRFVEHYQLLQEVAPAQRDRPGLTRDFGRIADYALQTRLPPGFLRNAELYSEAIARAPIDCLPDEQVARRLTGRLSTSYRQAVDAMYRDNLVAIAVDYIDRNFNGGVGAFDATSAPGPSDTDSWVRLGSLVAHLDTVSHEIALPGRYDWLADPARVTLPDVKGLRPLWDGTDLGPWLRESERPRAEQAAARLRNAVLTGAPIFVPGPAAAAAEGAAPVPTVALSPSAEETVKYLRALFAKPFMRAWRSGPIATGPGLWNVPALQAAAATAKEITTLPLDPPAPVPAGIADEAVTLARARSGTYLVRQVAAAIEPGLAAPAVDTANFVEALPPLQTIRAALRQTAASDQAPAIDARINAQAWRVLRSADAELALDGGPYAVDMVGLARWDGAGSLAAVAFATGSPDELKAILPQRRARVAELARGRVAPIVDYVRREAAGAPPPLAGSAARWAGIIRALDGFDAGPGPANSIARLEQFIAVDLDRLQSRGCADVSRAVGSRAGDWFANQQLAIGARVFDRCRAGLLAQIRARYGSIRSAFTDLIGGRFPFGAANAPGAEPAAVRAFFAAHGAALQPLKDQLDDVGIERAASAALGELIAAQAALAPMLAAGEPKPLSYTVQASFFTDADRARAQDQVIEASIGTLASRATTPGETGGFAWSNGEAVVIRLRWAANAPSLPKTGIAAAGGACEPAPAGAWYATRLDRDWALLRLLAAGTGDDAGGYGAGGYPVAIDVPLCANRASARLGDEPGDRARVFMRLLLAAPPPAPDKPAMPILLPRFPAMLPAFAELGGQGARTGSR